MYECMPPAALLKAGKRMSAGVRGHNQLAQSVLSQECIPCKGSLRTERNRDSCSISLTFINYQNSPVCMILRHQKNRHLCYTTLLHTLPYESSGGNSSSVEVMVAIIVVVVVVVVVAIVVVVVEVVVIVVVVVLVVVIVVAETVLVVVDSGGWWWF